MNQAMILDDSAWSHKAWMSQIDANLLERVILNLCRGRSRLDVLEWGTGKSTFYFGELLKQYGVPFSWLSLEYDREYFNKEIMPRLPASVPSRVMAFDSETADTIKTRQVDESLLEFVVFNYGKLLPFTADQPQDRLVNMDAYVDFPSALNCQFDFILVDGRKRRRCLVEASRLMKPHGITVLHDAYRRHYQCAFTAFASQRMLGEILWIGSQAQTDFLSYIL